MALCQVLLRLESVRVDGIIHTALPPKRSSEGAAGYDLHAFLPTKLIPVQCVTNPQASAPKLMDHIPPFHRARISTGVSFAIPKGWYGRIAGRSGLAWKNGLDIMAGVIDSDSRRYIDVILLNLSPYPFTIQSGDRIAQIIFELAGEPDLIVVNSLDTTQRGQSGYGSTGVRSLPSGQDTVTPRASL